VLHTAKLLAELLGIADEEIAAATTKNFYRLFNLTPDEGTPDV
jgi:TatD DNase family protein